MRYLNQEMGISIQAARSELYAILGEVDPVKINRGIAAALSALDDAKHSNYEVEAVCAAAAKRGRYNGK